jgi:hypothetical protein
MAPMAADSPIGVVAAMCDTTQQSGGQGTTRLSIDMMATSGTFPVDYEMYQIPDQLEVFYEGNVIYTTGGLVSGASSASVTFSGSTAVVEVVISAPEEGTLWDVFIGCPGSP